MTILAIGLLTLSAFFHAFWNFLSQRENPTAAYFLIASEAACILLSPVLLIFRNALAAIPISVWLLILATGFVQAIYYVFLAGAYRNGELSHAYPLARSLPVVLVALVSLMLGRGHQIQPLAYAGFVLVTAGCIILPQSTFRELRLRNYLQKWVLFAILTAACITSYTLLDDQSLRILRNLGDNGMTHIEWSILYLILETISLTVFLWVVHFIMGWKLQLTQINTFSMWIRAGVLGLIITATYGLVLLAMNYVQNVSYVSAFRQLSIPIGAALGLLVNREKAYLPKLIGIGVVVFGLVLVAVG